MNRRLLLSALACALALACDKPQGTSAGDANDIAGLLHPGTKGLVVQNPFGNRPNFFDFERVSYGTQARHVFQIKNEEPRTTTILDALPSCGCLRPIVQYKNAQGELVVGMRNSETVLAIPAGTTFELICEIDTTFVERMNLDKLVQVRLRTDSTVVPFIAFELHIVVERPFRAVPGIFELGEIARSAGKSAHADVSPESPAQKQRILRVAKVEGPFEASCDATHVNGVDYWLVNVSARPDLPLGPVHGRLLLATSGPDGTGEGEPFEIPIHGTVVLDVTPHPGLFAFGSFPTGKQKSCSVTLDAVAAGERFAFLGAQVNGAGADRIRLVRTAIDADANDRASSWTIELTAMTDFPFGAFSGMVDVQTDHPHAPLVRIPYTGSAQ